MGVTVHKGGNEMPTNSTSGNKSKTDDFLDRIKRSGDCGTKPISGRRHSLEPETHVSLASYGEIRVGRGISWGGDLKVLK